MTEHKLSDEQILALAHRTATTYAHRSDPKYHSYAFVPHTLLDFSRKLLALAAAGGAQQAQAGWRLVPVEPTPEMLAATSWPGCAAKDWERMISAAPLPQPEEAPSMEAWMVEAERLIYAVAHFWGEYMAMNGADGWWEPHNKWSDAIAALLAHLRQRPATREAQRNVDCTEPNRAACPRLCRDYCNKAEEEAAAGVDTIDGSKT